MKKGRRKSSYLKLMALFMVIMTMLGTSYAYWNQVTTIQSTITTGNIGMDMPVDSSGNNNENKWIVCTNIACNQGHTSTPLILKFKDIGTVSGTVESAEITGLTFYRPIYQKSRCDYYNGGHWKGILFWRTWVPHPAERDCYQYVGNEKIEIKDSSKLNALRNFTCSRCEKDGEYTYMTMNYAGGTTQEQFRNDMAKLLKDNNYARVEVGNGEYYDFSNTSKISEDGHKCLFPMACVDPSMEGELNLRVRYTQFNTYGTNQGWKEYQDITVPIEWVRVVMQESDWRNYWYKSIQDLQSGSVYKQFSIYDDEGRDTYGSYYSNPIIPSETTNRSPYELNIYPGTEVIYY